MRADQVTRLLERALLCVGIVCLGYYGYHSLEARHFHREQTAAFEAILAGAERQQLPGDSAALPVTDAASTPPAAESVAAPPASAVGSATTPSGAVRTPAAGAERARSSRAMERTDVMALLEIPRLKLSSPVMSGDDDATLSVAIGHLPDTPKFWEVGNSAVAAHRDGLFRPLRHIAIGDEVRVRTQHGDFVYTVKETKIVDPEDLSVLAPVDSHRLTLITCYPFNFIGNAPKRFIVHAERAASAAP